MSNGAAGAAGVAAAGAIANAIKASGAIVQVDPRDFAAIVDKTTAPLVVVCAQSWFFSTYYQYLTAYKGLIFCTKSQTPLQLPHGAETIHAKKIWTPG